MPAICGVIEAFALVALVMPSVLTHEELPVRIAQARRGLEPSRREQRSGGGAARGQEAPASRP